MGTPYILRCHTGLGMFENKVLLQFFSSTMLRYAVKIFIIIAMYMSICRYIELLDTIYPSYALHTSHISFEECLMSFRVKGSSGYKTFSFRTSKRILFVDTTTRGEVASQVMTPSQIL
jgi:hypothetical protein